MTLVHGIERFETKLVDRMRASFNELRRQSGRRAVFNKTVHELRALDDRELDDLDIARADIIPLARAAAARAI